MALNANPRPRSAMVLRNRHDIAVLIKLPPTTDEVHHKWQQQYSANCPYDSPSKQPVKLTTNSSIQQPDMMSSSHLRGIRLPLAAPRPSSANMARRPRQPLTSMPSEYLPIPNGSDEAMAELQIRAALIQACRNDNNSAANSQTAKPRNSNSATRGRKHSPGIRLASLFYEHCCVNHAQACNS